MKLFALVIVHYLPWKISISLVVTLVIMKLFATNSQFTRMGTTKSPSVSQNKLWNSFEDVITTFSTVGGG